MMDKIAEAILNTVNVHLIAGIGMIILSLACVALLYIVFTYNRNTAQILFKFDYRDMGHGNLMPHTYMTFSEAEKVIRENLVTDRDGKMVNGSKLTVYYSLCNPNTNRRTCELMETTFIGLHAEEIINRLEDIDLKMEMNHEKDN